MENVKREVVEIEKKTVEAFNKGDVDEILKYFDENIIGFSSTRHERLMGLEALRNTFLYYLKEAEKIEFSITSPVVQVYGDIAILSFYWLVVQIDGGRRREIQGRGTHVFHRKNGEWKIVHEHFSRAHHV